MKKAIIMILMIIHSLFPNLDHWVYTWQMLEISNQELIVWGCQIIK